LSSPLLAGFLVVVKQPPRSGVVAHLHDQTTEHDLTTQHEANNLLRHRGTGGGVGTATSLETHKVEEHIYRISGVYAVGHSGSSDSRMREDMEQFVGAAEVTGESITSVAPGAVVREREYGVRAVPLGAHHRLEVAQLVLARVVRCARGLGGDPLRAAEGRNRGKRQTANGDLCVIKLERLERHGHVFCGLDNGLESLLPLERVLGHGGSGDAAGSDGSIVVDLVLQHLLLRSLEASVQLVQENRVAEAGIREELSHAGVALVDGSLESSKVSVTTDINVGTLGDQNLDTAESVVVSSHNEGGITPLVRFVDICTSLTEPEHHAIVP